MARWSRALFSFVVLICIASSANAQFHQLPRYTIATLPANPSIGAQAVVTDGGCAGATLVGDGTNWRALMEKEQGIINVACPPYNVPNDGVTDAAPSLQAILDSETGGSIAKKPIYIPAGTYAFGKVLRLKGGALTITGAGQDNTILKALFKYGPVIVAYPSTNYATSLPLSTSLATGAGNSFQLSSTNKWLNLRDAKSMNLNGLGALTVELFYKPTTTPASSVILTSSGRAYGGSTAAGHAFYLEVAGGVYQASMKIGSTIKTVTSATAPVSGTTVHLAASYDGTTLRFFINGTSVGTPQAASGTITQEAYEDVLLGPEVFVWPEVSFNVTTADALVDSVRVSNTARYTSNFTNPSAKFSSDANTLMLLNFDNQYDVVTIGQTKDGEAHLFLRDKTGSQNERLFLSDLHIAGGDNPAAMFVLAVKHHLRRVKAQSNVWGLFFWNNTFESKTERIQVNISVPGRWGVAYSNQAGVEHIESPLLIGGKYNMVFSGGGAWIEHPYFQTESDTVTALIFNAFDDGQLTMADGIVNAESGGASLENAVILSHPGNVAILGGHIDMTNNKAPVLIDGGNATTSYLFMGTLFNPSAAATSIFKMAVIPTNPVVLLQTVSTQAAVPWSDTVNTTTRLEKGALTLGDDTILLRDAANTVAQKNGVSAQEARIYGTTTGPKYVSLKHDGTNATLDTSASSGKLIVGTNATSTDLGNKLTKYANAAPTDGQLFIGGTAAGNWTAGTLTDGAGVHAANGNNTITPQLSAYNAAGTRTNDVHIVQDTATLVAGTVTVTLSGSAVFTNATSYTCVAEDDSAIATTRVQQTSGTSITFTGTGTDVVRFICVGS